MTTWTGAAATTPARPRNTAGRPTGRTATDMAMAMAITATMGKKDEEKENKLSVVIKKSLSDRSGYRINHYFVSDGITYKI